MENFSYNSYPDSGNSSPRSRDIDFENNAPWEDQNIKAKFMCSYGGKIHPRPHDNQLAYIGGDTKILAADRTIKFSSMINKLSALCGEADVSFKYQLPGEDLDALISVTSDDDLEHMMHEYDRLYKASAKPARMRLFLFPAVTNSSFGSDTSKSERDRFVEALNSGPTHVSDSKKLGNNVDFLFGLEKGIPPSKILEAVQPPPPEYHVPDDRGIGTDRVVYTDHAVNPVEIQRQLQRLQMREQVQEAMFMKRTEENLAAGVYVAMPEKSPLPPVTVPLSVQQTAAFQVPSSSYPATVTGTHGQPEQPFYMIPQGTTIYHTPQPQPQPQPQQQQQPQPQLAPPMIRQVPSQPYYPNMQRMAPGPPAPDVYREQAVYNMVLPPPNLPQMGMLRPSGVGGGVSGAGVGATDAGYSQVAYDSGVGRQVYYTGAGGMVVQPPATTTYQGGVGVAVSGEMRGPDGKVMTKLSPN